MDRKGAKGQLAFRARAASATRTVSTRFSIAARAEVRLTMSSSIFLRRSRSGELARHQPTRRVPALRRHDMHELMRENARHRTRKIGLLRGRANLAEAERTQQNRVKDEDRAALSWLADRSRHGVRSEIPRFGFRRRKDSVHAWLGILGETPTSFRPMHANRETVPREDIFDLTAHRVERKTGIESVGIIPEKMKRRGIPDNLCPASLLG